MSEITKKERLLRAAHKQPVDRPPCICPGGMMNMIVSDIMKQSGTFWPEAHRNAKKMADLTYALQEAGGFENYGVPYCMTVEAEAMGAEVDMGSLEVEPHVVISPLNSVTQAGLLKPLDLTRGRVATVLEAIRILKAKGTDAPIIGNLTGPISVAGTLVDMSTLLMELCKKPEDSQHLLDLITDNIIIYAKAQIEAGADVICLSEPSGTGEILGLKHFRNYTVKYINRIMDALDVPVKMVHICGRLRSVYSAISEIYCDVFSFDAFVNIEEIKTHIPEKAIMGNVSTHALSNVSSKKVARMTQVALKKGANIVAPACGLPITTPLRNIQAMVKAAQLG